ncbi:MAG: DNA polymerase III subunit beta [Chitinophagales bacterium]|nr:DNA polymerase III subunit beta [Chitinophagales bacterium]
MKLIVSSGALLKNLQNISGIISTNTVLPILEDFHFDIQDGILVATATDLETSVSTKFPVEATENFKIAIPAKTLMNILKELPEQPVTISIDETNYAIELTTDNGKYKLAGENADDFPKLPELVDMKTVKIPSEVLHNGIYYTIFATSNDELRPAMGGVFTELGSNGITFVATDAHKLVKYGRKDIEVENSGSFIFPKKALNLLKSVIPNSNEEITISYSTRNACVEIGTTMLICRLIEHKFPEYNNVIPINNPNLLTINRGDLFSALRRVIIFSNKTTNQVVFKIVGNTLEINAQDLDFSNEAVEQLPCEYAGEDMEIGFNSKFLIEMLNVISDDEVKLELSTPSRAGILKPVNQTEEEDILMLVMPVMINR